MPAPDALTGRTGAQTSRLPMSGRIESRMGGAVAAGHPLPLPFAGQTAYIVPVGRAIIMTPKRFNEAIEIVGLTKESAHLFFGVDDRLARRWLSGEFVIPRTVELLVELMVSHDLTAERVEQITRIDDE
jgi:hypothetical protein